eukprot:gene1942-2209_t
MTTGTKRIIVLPTDTDDTVILLFYWQQLKVNGLKELCVKTGVVEDDLLVPDLGLHPIPEKYSLFCTYGKSPAYDVPVKRMAYLVVRFATLKALLQMMAQAARTHLVASIELTLCNTVSVGLFIQVWKIESLV